MVSIKPGRGPSLMGGIAAIAVGILGVGWTVTVMSIGAPPFFALFGIIFVCLAIGMGIYNFYNATSRNRFSHFDITTDQQESDPLADAMGYTKTSTEKSTSTEHFNHSKDTEARQYQGDYCPFCGNKVEKHFDFCPNCGKDI